VRFFVLGPFEVWDGDVQLELGRELRPLLALLALHRNEVLSLDRIIDALRRRDPPAAAQRLIDDDAQRLREVLGDDAVVSRPWGYGLRAPAGSIDLDAFEGLVARARNEDPAVAANTLREALALWRGPALADFADTSFARDEIARLEAARRAAQEELLELSTKAEGGVGDAPEEPQRRRHLAAGTTRWKVAAAGTAAVIVVATIVIVWGVAPGESRHVATGPNMVAALDPKANRVVDAFTVGSVPTDVGVGGESVWVYNSNDKNVSLVDPRTRLVRTVSTGGDVSTFAVGPNSAWVGNGWSGTVSRIDPHSAEIVRTIRLPGKRYTAAGFIATSASEIWISGVTLSPNAPSPLEPPPNPPPAHFPPPHFLAWRIDPRTNTVTRTISLVRAASFARTFVITRDSVLVRSDYALLRIDRLTGAAEMRLVLPSNGCCESAGLALGEGSIWVIGLARSVLWRIDSRGGGAVIRATIPLPGQPAGVAVGAGAVWVADATGAILKIDPKKNEIVKRIPITGVPHSLAFGLGRLWVALD
jgi:streptogramin lyase